jgi:hypothetical protein
VRNRSGDVDQTRRTKNRNTWRRTPRAPSPHWR